MDGIELMDREFVAAISEGRESRSGIASVYPCYETMHELEKSLES
jgi:2-hydroxy-4-carboxymuconate semialdehyde hemiacetal dehydrogenase